MRPLLGGGVALAECDGVLGEPRVFHSVSDRGYSSNLYCSLCGEEIYKCHSRQRFYAAPFSVEC